jgi:hypothetical protein
MDSPRGLALVAVAVALAASFWVAPELALVAAACSALLVLLPPGRRQALPDDTKIVEWEERPKAWHRLMGPSAMIAAIGVMVGGIWLDGFIDTKLGIPLRYVVATVFALGAVATARLLPRRVILTESGLFVEAVGLLDRRALQLAAPWTRLQGFALHGDSVTLALSRPAWLPPSRESCMHRELHIPPLYRDSVLACLRRHAVERHSDARSAINWRPVLLVWAVLTLVTNLPYLHATFAPPAGRTFVGFHAYVPDMLNYASYVQQAEEGTPLFRNKLYFGDQPAVLINLEWWFVGLLSRLLGRSPALAYRLFCALVSLPLIALVHRTLRCAGLPRSHRTAALLLVFTGAGLGGLRHVLWNQPLLACLDLYVALFPIVELLNNPHFVVGTLLVLLDLELFSRAKDRRSTAVAMLAGTVHGLVRPYDIAVVCGARILTICATCPPRAWVRQALPLFGLGPVLGYDAWALLANPSFAIFSNPDIYKPIQPYRYPWAIVPAILLALPGLRSQADRTTHAIQMTLASWMLVGVALIVAPPVDYATQFLTGLGLPCLMLAALGLARLRVAWTWMLVALLSTSGMVVLWRMLRHPEPEAYAVREHWEAAMAMRASCRQGSRLLAPADIGLYAAALTDCSPYVSHLSVRGHAQRVERLREFFESDDSAHRSALLQALGITHVAFPGTVSAEEAFGANTPFRQLSVVGMGADAVSVFGR